MTIRQSFDKLDTYIYECFDNLELSIQELDPST